ncbi:MAG: glutaredoxin 3 [Methyloligellaceae bacterium]
MLQVTIYTAMLCPYCHAAKRLLSEKGVDVNEIDTTFSRGRRAEMRDRSAGAHTVPQIFIGDVHVGGCDELYALDEQGKLDALLSA